MTADPWEPWASALDAAVAAADEPRLAALLEDLWRVPLREVRARDTARWDHLFEILLAQLASPAPRLRSLALHYLGIVMGAEYGPPLADGPGGHSRDDRRLALQRRTAQLLPALGEAVRRGTVSLPRAVDDLVRLEERADLAPQESVRTWIAEVASSPALARAVQIAYLDGRAPWNEEPPSGATAEQALWSAMDDPDVLVRAYAARALGQRYCERADAEQGDGLPPLAVAVATLTAREIERPGIAGPFFSNWYSPGGGPEAFEREAGVRLDEWILKLLAERRGPEPDTLPCSNGIDFFAHELFGGQAGMIERLLALGHEEIAIEAATEIDERIDDLLPVLVALAAREDGEVCRRASWHLASHHRVLDPNGGDLAAGLYERLRVLWHGPPGAWSPTL